MTFMAGTSKTVNPARFLVLVETSMVLCLQHLFTLVLQDVSLVFLGMDPRHVIDLHWCSWCYSIFGGVEGWYTCLPGYIRIFP